MIKEISDTMSRWKSFANALNVSSKLRDEIDATLIQLK